ncbi:pre-mRNA branch site protein p14 [Trichophyton rubrum]|uniref:Pre-mRNA branch site protein p14 n=1 Tax=Trichophyton rubrum TaxID=5551 RepID=A0A178EQN3_TRIRU|nr:pre-mRNA branch site protein p14 [Trichophyton rubrum]
MSRSAKLAPEANRILFVKNLSYNVTAEELFDLFGKFGPIRQIRQGIATNSKGTAFVVYEDVTDAKQACDKLNGFNFQNRYLVAREDGPIKNRPRRAPGESRTAQIATWHRLTTSAPGSGAARFLEMSSFLLPLLPSSGPCGQQLVHPTSRPFSCVLSGRCFGRAQV